MYLSRAGRDVRDVCPNRTNERDRGRRRGKSDAIDSVKIAREVHADTDLPVAFKRAGGDAGPDETTECLQLWHRARRSVLKSRQHLLNEAEALLVALPEEIRTQLPDTSEVRPRLGGLPDLDPTLAADTATRTRLALLETHRIDVAELDRGEKDIAGELGRLVDSARSTLGGLCGIAKRSDAELLVEVGDPRRLTGEGGFARFNGTAPLPASSAEGNGQPTRHRLNRGGNRRVNTVLHRMAVTQLRCEPRAWVIYENARSRRHTKKEAMRILRWVIEAHERNGPPAERVERARNFDGVADLVAKRVASTRGRISAKRLLPAARAAGYDGSGRNFRRLVADAKRAWRADHHRDAVPGVWAPGEVVAIDWGAENGLHVFCAVLAWSRWRFVGFADNERAETTFDMPARCFEAMGGVAKVVLADRVGCLKGGVVANVVIPTPAYVRFAIHYGFRPDFCEGGDPESKSLVENLVGYAKADLITPQAPFADLAAANEAGRQWCGEVNAALHSEICAVPAERLAVERPLLSTLPQLRPSLGSAVIRKVDKLSCIRVGSARYSVPDHLVGRQVEVSAGGGRVRVVNLGVVVADHALVAPGEASINDDHYRGPRPAPRPSPRRRRPRSFRSSTAGRRHWPAAWAMATA